METQLCFLRLCARSVKGVRGVQDVFAGCGRVGSVGLSIAGGLERVPCPGEAYWDKGSARVCITCCSTPTVTRSDLARTARSRSYDMPVVDGAVFMLLCVSLTTLLHACKWQYMVQTGVDRSQS